MKKERKIDAQKKCNKKVVESGNQGIEKHVTKKRERGITLIALVVTIIIMLILAAVTLNMALGDNGLVQMAKFAASKYEEAADNESIAMQGLANDINNPGNGTQAPPSTSPSPTPPDRSQLNKGDEVKYTPQKNETTYTLYAKQSGYGSSPDESQTILQETYTWKVMNIGEDGTVEIMGVPTSSMQKVWFKGATGYNNGVYLLNDICSKLYSNNDLGATARSLNIDDIEKHFNEAGQKAKTDYINGKEKTYEDTNGDRDTFYPKLAKYEGHIGVNGEEMGNLKESDDGRSLGETLKIPLEESNLLTYSDSYSSAIKELKVKQTYYTITPKRTDFDDGAYLNLFFGTSTYYWLASRYSACSDTNADFGLRRVGSVDISGYCMFRSRESTDSHSHFLAPVVSLGPNIQLTNVGDGTWKLPKSD